MSTNPAADPAGQAMVRAFPEGGALIRLAYRELHIAANGTKEQVTALGDPRLLPRPWDPPTCRTAELRQQVWAWLEDVASWLNTEYVWDVAAVIPGCWPRHPHLVHELAVLADQRRRAGTALSSDALEEWHRYALPGFVDRMRTRTRDHCEEGHQGWPPRRADHARARNRSGTAAAGRRRPRDRRDHRRPRLATPAAGPVAGTPGATGTAASTPNGITDRTRRSRRRPHA